MMLVTGATSAVGRAVVQELLEREIPVRAFVRKSQDVEKLAAQGVEVFLGDMTERESTRESLQGIQSVYLVAPGAEHQLVTELLWIEEAKKAGISLLVKQSEIGADAQSFCPLLAYHGRIEEALRSSSLSYGILRTLYFMQNFGPMYAHSIATEGRFYAPLADTPMSYVDARDVARVAVHLLTEEKYRNQEYEVTGPEALSCSQLVELFSTFLGKPIQYTNISDEEAQQGLLGIYPLWMAHAVSTLLQFYRQGGADFVTSVIEDITARKPCTVQTYLSEHPQTFQID